MKNPLSKRLLREFGKEWKKYVVLFLLMVFMIGLVSGIYVGNDSMMTSIAESFTKYKIEDGHFELKEKATDELIDKMSDGITIYEQFYKDTDEDINLDGKEDATVRLFKIRTEVNLTCVMDGRLPEADGEIAIDRMHADNNNIVIGDTLNIDGDKYIVTGLVASSDYSTLFKKNSDLMFNALIFNLGFVTDSDWDKVDSNIIYSYAYKYDVAPATEMQKKKLGDDTMERLAVLAATGGYTSDKDEAQALSDNITLWTNYLEDIENRSNELESRADELIERQSTLEENMALLMAGDPDTMAEAQALQEEFEALQADVDALAALEPEINEAADNLKALEPYDNNINELTDFVPEYANQSIHFAPDDMGSDKAMMAVLVYIFIGVLAFVFAITTSNTITSEAAVIGTLRSTGYTRGELLRHYMMIPLAVTLVSAIAGNILGYTVFKDVAVNMYYNSYSLMTYETIWNATAFIKTTVIPLVLMSAVNFFVIYRKLRLSPLRFLRRDLSTSKRKKAMRLPSFRFLNRFRLRIFLNNLGGYIVLFFGIAFVMLLLAFAIGLPQTLEHYKQQATDNMIAPYQYILKNYKDEDDNIISTDTKVTQKFSIASLKTTDGVHIGEEISVYGIDDDGEYIILNDGMEEGQVEISAAYASKFGLESGDSIVLQERYSENSYTFTVSDVYDYSGALAIFMPNGYFNSIFDKDKDSFSGFFSDRELTDIDSDLIYNILTLDDVTSVATQLDHSMGSAMNYVAVVCMIMAILIMYLLTKIIIEKNAASISMIKVLGYENREVNSLYILLTSIVVVISGISASFLALAGLKGAFSVMMYSMNGWFDVYLAPSGFIKMIVILIICYAIVAFFDMQRIRKIPLSDALKNVE